VVVQGYIAICTIMVAGIAAIAGATAL